MTRVDNVALITRRTAWIVAKPFNPRGIKFCCQRMLSISEFLVLQRRFDKQARREFALKISTVTLRISLKQVQWKKFLINPSENFRNFSSRIDEYFENNQIATSRVYTSVNFSENYFSPPGGISLLFTLGSLCARNLLFRDQRWALQSTAANSCKVRPFIEIWVSKDIHERVV